MHLLPAKTSKPNSGGVGFPTHTVRKVCRCGTEFDGQSFTAPIADAPPVPGRCAACLAAEEQRYQALTHPVPVVSATALPELTRPRRVEDLDGLDD